MHVSVVVGTFGDHTWGELALARAVPSARALGVEVIHSHRDTLHGARNMGLTCVETEWVCFLDADDELEPGYLDAMATGTADLRAPSVRYIDRDREYLPRMPRVAGHGHDCTADCLTYGNWLVIGTLAPTALVREVGGFRDFPCYEDWDLWVRCWQAGATIEPVTRAIYRAYMRPDSRNRAPSRDVKHEAHQAIARANGLEVPA